MAVWQRVSSDLSTFADGRDIPEDTLNSFIVSLEVVYRELVVLATTSQLTDTQRELIAIVRTCLSSLKSIYELHISFDTGFLHPLQPVQTGMVGRPSFEISPNQLSFLIENGFSVPQMADMICI